MSFGRMAAFLIHGIAPSMMPKTRLPITLRIPSALGIPCRRIYPISGLLLEKFRTDPLPIGGAISFGRSVAGFLFVYAATLCLSIGGCRGEAGLQRLHPLGVLFRLHEPRADPIECPLRHGPPERGLVVILRIPGHVEMQVDAVFDKRLQCLRCLNPARSARVGECDYGRQQFAEGSERFGILAPRLRIVAEYRLVLIADPRARHLQIGVRADLNDDGDDAVLEGRARGPQDFCRRNRAEVLEIAAIDDMTPGDTPLALDLPHGARGLDVGKPGAEIDRRRE